LRSRFLLLCLLTFLVSSVQSREETQQHREIHNITETGSFLFNERDNLRNLSSQKVKIRGSRQDIIWHKVYQYTLTRSLALGFNNTVFFGGSDFAPVEVALYPLLSDYNPPEPLWTYEGEENTDWFVDASEAIDLYAGLNYLPADFDDEGDGYCHLYIWHYDSSIPLWTYDFTGYLPASTEPIVISEEDGEIFVAMRDLIDDLTRVYIFSAGSSEPSEVISFNDSIAQMLRVSSDGKIIGLLQGSFASIYDRETGSLRQRLRIGSSTINFAMSASGDRIITGWREAVVHQWDGSRYREKFRYRDSDGTWYHRYCSISGDGSTAVITANKSDYSLNRVHLVNLIDYELIWSYQIERAEGSDLQLLPSQSDISHDGSIFILGNWGDDSESNPALMVFQRETPQPYFLHSPGGSITSTAITKNAPYYAAAAGKLVHMNIWGAGTNLYSLDLEIEIDYATLAGTIADADSGLPLPGVRLICGEWDETHTDVNGSYSFSSLVPGDYNLRVSKQGYYDIIVESVNIQPDANVLIDLELEPIPVVSLQGRVVKGDMPSEGLSEADISLRGYDDYHTQTDIEGDFEFENVFIENTYELIIDHPQYNEHTQTVVVEKEDIVLNDIPLVETPFPVNNVMAIVTGNNEVLLSWSDPVSAMLREFSYDNGNVEGAVGFYNGTSASVLGALYHHNASIESISWHLSGTVTHETVNLFIFDLDEDGYPLSTELLYMEEGIKNVQGEWNTHFLPLQVSAPNGFLIGISSTSGEHLGISVDSGDELQPYTQFYVFDYTIGMEFTPYFTGNYFLRARGYDYGYISYPDFDYRLLSNSGFPAPKRAKTEFYTDTRNRVAGSMSSSSLFAPSVRVFKKYNIYRFLSGNLHNTEEWEFIGSTAGNQYLDTDWLNIPDGDYLYGVTALYSDDNESPAAMSNLLTKNLNSSLTVYIMTNSGDTAEGALLELLSADEDQVLYHAFADEEGKVQISDIERGIYDIRVSLAGFMTERINGIELIPDEVILEFELIEKLIPVSGLQYTLLDDNGYDGVKLNWSAPSEAGNRGTSKGADRSLHGYRILRNGIVVEENVQDTLFTDYPPVSGFYVYGVQGVYDSGLSPAVYTEEIELTRPPIRTELQGSYPNPFNRSTQIKLTLAAEDTVTLEIFNVRGVLVKEVISENLYPGEYLFSWPGTDRRGKRVASGVYLCKMTAGSYRGYIKMLLLK